MTRGRPPKEKVKLNKTSEESVNLVPVSNSQLEEAGIDTEKEVEVEREVREGMEEIVLKLEEVEE